MSTPSRLATTPTSRFDRQPSLGATSSGGSPKGGFLWRKPGRRSAGGGSGYRGIVASGSYRPLIYRVHRDERSKRRLGSPYRRNQPLRAQQRGAVRSWMYTPST